MLFWGHPRGHSRGELDIDPYGSFSSDCGNLRIGVMHNVLSFFLTNSTGAPQEDLDGHYHIIQTFRQNK